MGQEGTNLFRCVILLNPYKNHRRRGTGVVNTNRTYHEHCFKHFMYLLFLAALGLSCGTRGLCFGMRASL